MDHLSLIANHLAILKAARYWIQRISKINFVIIIYTPSLYCCGF